MNEELRRRLLAEAGLPLIWLALTAVALVPVWHQPLLPMLDTPHDLALARAWHSYHDPAYKLADYYTLHVRPFPPVLFYAVISLLTYVCKIEVANKLFLSLYLILFPLSVLALARALRRSPWLAIGAFALAFNESWIYGRAPVLMGIALMFFALAALIRWLNEGRRWQIVWLGVAGLLCYLSSLEVWACLLACTVALVLRYRRQWRNALLAALTMVPSATLAAIQWRTDRRLHGMAATWHDFPKLVMEFPRRVMELFPGNGDRLVLGIIALTVVALVVWKRTRLADDSPAQKKQLHLLLLVLSAAYLLLPYQLTKPTTWYLAPLVPAMIAPLLLLLPALPAAAPLRWWQRLFFLPIAVACVVLPLQLSVLYRDFSRRNSRFMHMVERLPDGARVLVVVHGMLHGNSAYELPGDVASSAPVYWYFTSWPMALHGGYDPYLTEDDMLVEPKVKLAAPSRSEIDLFNPREAPNFEYYLVRGQDDNMERQPSLKVIERYGEWVAFKRIYSMTDEP